MDSLNKLVGFYDNEKISKLKTINNNNDYSFLIEKLIIKTSKNIFYYSSIVSFKFLDSSSGEIIAMTRIGPPVPPFNFIGKAYIVKFVRGNKSKFATFSIAKMLL